MKKAVRVYIFGTVQGVFFRDNTRKRAIELGLNGYAKNLLDGNVEVVAEGDENKIKELIEFIRKGPGIAKVTDIKMQHKELGNFKKFEIMY